MVRACRHPCSGRGRCELRLYRLKPAYPQSSDAIDDFVNLFGRVLGRFHFEPNAGMKVKSRQPGSRMHAANRSAFRAESLELPVVTYEPGTFLYLYKVAHSQSNWQTIESSSLRFMGRRRNLVSPSIIVMSCCLEDQKPQPAKPPAGAFLLARLKAGLADGGRKRCTKQRDRSKAASPR
jgi:hypothetical protein